MDRAGLILNSPPPRDAVPLVELLDYQPILIMNFLPLDKIFSNAIVVISAVLAIITVVGEQGILNLFDTNAELQNIKTKNHALETQIFNLRNKIYAIKNDEVTLEYIAREELGYAKKNEVLYNFK